MAAVATSTVGLYAAVAHCEHKPEQHVKVTDVLKYLASRTQEVFILALENNPSVIKKFANCIKLTADWFRHFEKPISQSFAKVAGEMNVTRTVLATLEVFTKWKDVKAPLRETTIFVPSSKGITPLDKGGAIQSSNYAEAAPMWEKSLKKASQVADWVFSVSDMAEYMMNAGVIHLSQKVASHVKYALSAVTTLGSFVMSGFSVCEEVYKLATGYIVRANSSYRYDSKHLEAGVIWEMTWEDKVHSGIKIAMGLSYLVLAGQSVYALAGVPGPFAAYAKTITLAASSMATVTSLANHFWDKIAISTLGRSGQGFLPKSA